MVAISRQYTREMYEKFGYFATWLPNVRLKLGDVGVVKERAFEPASSLEKLGIAFDTDCDRQPADVDYTSSDAVSIETKVSGAVHDPAAMADGNISISFSRADAVVFQASGCVASKIADVKSLGDRILALYHRGAWNPDHVVVTDLISAAGATILISNGSNAHIDLALKGQPAADMAALANASANIAVTRAVGIGTRIVAAAGLTPLFKVAGVRRRIFRDDQFARREAEDVQFVELDYKDLL
jgi:hypothetical protein